MAMLIIGVNIFLLVAQAATLTVLKPLDVTPPQVGYSDNSGGKTIDTDNLLQVSVQDGPEAKANSSNVYNITYYTDARCSTNMSEGSLLEVSKTHSCYNLITDNSSATWRSYQLSCITNVKRVRVDFYSHTDCKGQLVAKNTKPWDFFISGKCDNKQQMQSPLKVGDYPECKKQSLLDEQELAVNLSVIKISDEHQLSGNQTAVESTNTQWAIENEIVKKDQTLEELDLKTQNLIANLKAEHVREMEELKMEMQMLVVTKDALKLQKHNVEVELLYFKKQERTCQQGLAACKLQVDTAAHQEAERNTPAVESKNATAQVEGNANVAIGRNATAETERNTSAKTEKNITEETEGNTTATADAQMRLTAEAEVKSKAERNNTEAEKFATVATEMVATAESERNTTTEAEGPTIDQTAIEAKVEEMKAKLYPEIKAKMENEMHAKALAEVKATAQADMSAKEDAERKTEEEAESNANVEEEMRLKAEAEVKARAEAERNANDNSGATAKQDDKMIEKTQAELEAKIEADILDKVEAKMEAKMKAALETRAIPETNVEAKIGMLGETEAQPEVTIKPEESSVYVEAPIEKKVEAEAQPAVSVKLEDSSVYVEAPIGKEAQATAQTEVSVKPEERSVNSEASSGKKVEAEAQPTVRTKTEESLVSNADRNSKEDGNDVTKEVWHVVTHYKDENCSPGKAMKQERYKSTSDPDCFSFSMEDNSSWSFRLVCPNPKGFVEQRIHKSPNCEGRVERTGFLEWALFEGECKNRKRIDVPLSPLNCVARSKVENNTTAIDHVPNQSTIDHVPNQSLIGRRDSNSPTFNTNVSNVISYYDDKLCSSENVKGRDGLAKTDVRGCYNVATNGYLNGSSIKMVCLASPTYVIQYLYEDKNCQSTQFQQRTMKLDSFTGACQHQQRVEPPLNLFELSGCEQAVEKHATAHISNISVCDGPLCGTASQPSPSHSGSVLAAGCDCSSFNVEGSCNHRKDDGSSCFRFCCRNPITVEKKKEIAWSPQ